MSSDYLIRALNGQKVDVKSDLHHNGEVSFNHTNDSKLAQLKALTGVENHFISFDSNLDLVVQSSSSTNYVSSVGANLDVTGGELSVDLSSKADVSSVTAVSNDLDVLNSSVTSLTGRVENLEIAPEYISTVGPNLNVSGGELTVDLANYALSSELANYALSSDLVNYAQDADLDAVEARVVTLEGSANYISSVGSNLAVSSGVLSVSGLVEHTENQIDGNTYFHNKVVTKGVNSNLTKTEQVFTTAATAANTAYEFFSLDNTGKNSIVHVKLYRIYGASFGCVNCYYMFDYDSVSLLASGSNVLYGTCNGSEFTLDVSGGAGAISFKYNAGASDSKFVAEVSVITRVG